VKYLNELVVLFIREFGWSAFTRVVVDDLLNRLISEPVEPADPTRQSWTGVSVPFSDLVHPCVVFFEVVNHRHQPLCRLLVLDLRESIAEVVKSGGVERSHML